MVTCKWGFFLCSVLKMPLGDCSRHSHSLHSVWTLHGDFCQCLQSGTETGVSARTANTFRHTGYQCPQVTVTKKAEQGKTCAVHQLKPRHSAPGIKTKDDIKALTTNVFEKGKEKQIHERSKRTITLNAQDFFWILCDSTDCGTRSAQTAQNDSTKQTGKSFLTLKHGKPNKQNFIVPVTLNPFSFFPHRVRLLYSLSLSKLHQCDNVMLL